MADSILDSTKKILGLDKDYTPFDLDILTHINSAFSILNQLGIGPVAGFSIEDNTATWDDFETPLNQLNLIKTWLFLKVRMYFDPPSTSYLIEAMNRQIAECEWRLSVFREQALIEALALLEPIVEEEEVA